MLNIDQLKEKYLTYYRQLPNQKLASAKIGRTDDTIINWRKEDEEFDRKVNEAKADWALETVKKVRRKEWLLERILNDHFKDRKEVEVALPIPIMGGTSMKNL